MSISNVQKVWKLELKADMKLTNIELNIRQSHQKKTHGAIFRHFELNTITCWLDKGEWDRYQNDDIPLQTLDNYPAAQLLSVINTSLRATQTNWITQISKHQISLFILWWHKSSFQIPRREPTLEKLSVVCQLFKFNSLLNFINRIQFCCLHMRSNIFRELTLPSHKLAFWKMYLNIKLKDQIS